MVPNSVLFSFSSSTLIDAKSTITPASIHYTVCIGIATHKYMYLSYTRYMKIFVFYDKYKFINMKTSYITEWKMFVRNKALHICVYLHSCALYMSVYMCAHTHVSVCL